MHREFRGNHWESLLRRPHLATSASARSETNSGRTILLTGAGGGIGSALAKTLVTCDPRLLILLDHSEQNLHQVQMELAALRGVPPQIAILGNISDGALVGEIFERHRPEIVYHAAAFKQVPLMEANPLAAVRNNVLGTCRLAEACVEHQAAQLVLISTDKAVNPQSVMGVSKRVAELALLRWSGARTQMKIVRLGNVLGSQGSVVPLFREQIARGGPVTVTHPDVERYLLTLREAVDLILAAASLETEGSIFVPELGAPVKILDLARHMIRTAGFEPETELPIVFTGLRPGDKMTEEMVSAGETSEPSTDRRLRRVSSAGISAERFDGAIAELGESVEQRDAVLLLEVLCRIVPEYRPSETLLGSLHRSPV